MIDLSPSRSRRALMGPLTSGSGASPAPLINAIGGAHGND
jgi:hypothetical protein